MGDLVPICDGGVKDIQKERDLVGGQSELFHKLKIQRLGCQELHDCTCSATCAL
jgi:hypothetical protein